MRAAAAKDVGLGFGLGALTVSAGLATPPGGGAALRAAGRMTPSDAGGFGLPHADFGAGAGAGAGDFGAGGC